MEKNYTPSQRLAIESDNSNILVSASAGAGKTYVMMERITRLVLEKGVDIDKILCVTFTNLAAKEMKEKLAKTLTEELTKVEGEKRAKLLYQLELLPTAPISTIHVFCKNLLSEFFYQAGLDPAFTILDDKGSKTLVNRVIDRLFEDLYENHDQDLTLLLPYLFKKRRDKNLKEKVINVYYSLISEAYPEQILEEGAVYYTPKGVNLIASEFAKAIYKEASLLLNEGKKLAEKCSHYEKFAQYVEHVAGVAEIICSHFNKDNLPLYYEEMCAFAPNVVIKAKPRKSKNEDPFELEVDFLANEYKEKVKRFLKNIETRYSVESLAKEKQEAVKTASVYNAFKKITLAFMNAFTREKRIENVVDFSDLEHLTLNLLKNEEVKEEVASRFEYIFTDEYQDTSGVQEEILSLISRNNLFMVGDVKQSIYDFRGCNPDIFANKYKKYQAGEGGIAINLDKNFRSSKNVLTAVNNLFSDIMTEECGRVDYKNNLMEVGAPYPENEGETKMFSVPKAKQEKILPEGVYSVVGHLNILTKNSSFSEGVAVANLVESLIGQEYYDVKEKRLKSIDYGDIALLLRDANKDADKYREYFARRAIPISAPSKDSIANYPEVAQVIDILKLINCYNQDIPLASVLKSKIGNLSDRDLLTIRKFTPKGSFVDAVKNYAENNVDEISAKISSFEQYFNGIRLLAEFTPCGELLAKIVSEKGIDVQILAKPLGETRLARLNKFIEVASASGQTVSEFMVGLDAQVEKLTMATSAENAVQIMSIHASKGLEYPIVILGRTTKSFSIESTKGDFLVDRYYGVSINHRNLDEMLITESLFNKYLKYLKTKRMREEEMRLLYVAMTRAKNRLYLINEYDSEKDYLPKPTHDDNVYGATSYFKMFAQGDFEVLDGLNIPESAKTTVVRQVLVSEADEYMTGDIGRYLAFEYPFKERSVLSVKRSVTKAAHPENEEERVYEKSAIFNESDTLTGNAYHRFLELCDFNLSCEDAFNSAIGTHLMEEEYKKVIEKEKALKILQMPIFNEIKSYTLFKEQPFTCFMPASFVEENYDGAEEILIQGIIDLLAIKDGKAIIIDYKHSGIINEQKLIERYRKQLEFYAYAVNKVLKLEVESCYLVNVNTCKLIKVNF